jgi:serine/threonine kinase 38
MYERRVKILDTRLESRRRFFVMNGVGMAQADLRNQTTAGNAMTAEKAGVAKDYTTTYYRGVVQDERSFVKQHTRARDRKMTITDFELLRVIGSGAFGEVRLCYKRDDPHRRVLALKTMRKSKMIEGGHVKHVRAERDLMVEARRKGLDGAIQNWIVELHFTFQDDEFLYFVMEFCPGGDMMTWLIRLEIFSIPVAKFYTAELVQAVQTIHQLAYAHRDLKPDNILLTAEGHMKLTDFGLCKQAPTDSGGSSPAPAELGPDPAAEAQAAGAKRGHSRLLFGTVVGSPGYTAPEVLEGNGYGMECDWWGVGVILYEMLVGYPPFSGDNNAHTGHKIMRWREYLEFPGGVDAIDSQAKDLITKLVCGPRERLTYEQIIAHPFFTGIDWRNLSRTQPPLRMNVQGPADTRNFEDEPQTQPLRAGGGTKPSADQRYLFSGFTAKFENPTATTRPSGNKPVRPTIPDFEGMS